MSAYRHICFISQSGALCTAVLDFATDRDFGFSKFISIGNKADVAEPLSVFWHTAYVRGGGIFVEVFRDVVFRFPPTDATKRGAWSRE